MRTKSCLIIALWNKGLVEHFGLWNKELVGQTKLLDKRAGQTYTAVHVGTKACWNVSCENIQL